VLIAATESTTKINVPLPVSAASWLGVRMDYEGTASFDDVNACWLMTIGTTTDNTWTAGCTLCKAVAFCNKMKTCTVK
jgi:hypothetical protein